MNKKQQTLSEASGLLKDLAAINVLRQKRQNGAELTDWENRRFRELKASLEAELGAALIYPEEQIVVKHSMPVIRLMKHIRMLPDFVPEPGKTDGRFFQILIREFRFPICLNSVRRYFDQRMEEDE